ncbi:MAG: preprotein translocase subunit SecG [Ruminococcaceae bacterium]|nr:preprotein translocase subunit SecG [Oscillospiraceae bacterium]
MGIIEIIAAIVLILACVFIVFVVIMQDTKQGMSQTITGGSADNYYQKNAGRSNEAKLNRLTKTAAFTFFIVALVANFIVMYSGNFASLGNTSSTTSSVTSSTTSSSTSSTTSETSSTTSDTSATSSETSTEATSSTTSTESSAE